MVARLRCGAVQGILASSLPPPSPDGHRLTNKNLSRGASFRTQRRLCHYRQLLSKSRQYRGRNSLYPLSTRRNIALPLQLQTHLVVRCARTSPGSSNQLIIRQLSAFQVAQRPLDANARSKIIIFLRQEPPHVTAILVMQFAQVRRQVCEEVHLEKREIAECGTWSRNAIYPCTIIRGEKHLREAHFESANLGTKSVCYNPNPTPYPSLSLSLSTPALLD